MNYKNSIIKKKYTSKIHLWMSAMLFGNRYRTLLYAFHNKSITFLYNSSTVLNNGYVNRWRNKSELLNY